MSSLFRASFLALCAALPLATHAAPPVTIDGAGLLLSNVPYTAGETYIFDNVPPAAPTTFAAVATGNNVALTWTNPTDADFASSTIRGSMSGYPTTISSGILIAQGLTGTSTHDNGLTGGTYYYSIFALDALGNVSSAAITRVTIDLSAPTVAGVAGPADGTYYEGQQLDFSVTYSKDLIVSGAPSIALTIGTTTRQAVYVASASTAAKQVFRYTVQAGDADADGIAVASPIALNGGAMKDSSGNDAELGFTPPATTGVLVSDLLPSVALLTHAHGSATASGSANSTVLPRGALSDDGRYLVFSSLSSDLIAGTTDNAGKEDVYLYDLVARTITLVSHTASSVASSGNDLSYAPAISGDGNWVVYASAATNLVTGQMGGNSNIFLWHRPTNTNHLVSTASDATLVHGESSATLSGANATLPAAGLATDGSSVYVLYRTNALNGGQVNLYHVALDQADPAVRTRRLVSHSNTSAAAAVGVSSATNVQTVGQPVMSPDGRYVVFYSAASDLVSGQEDTNGVNDLFLWDRDHPGMDNIRLISHAPGDEKKASTVGTGTTSGRPAISGDGKWIAWTSRDTNIVAGQSDVSGAFDDVFLYEVASGNNLLVSRSAGSAVLTGRGGGTAVGLPGISRDGRYVTFAYNIGGVPGGYLGTGFATGYGRAYFLFDRLAAVAYPAAYRLTPLSIDVASPQTPPTIALTTPHPALSADASVAIFGNAAATMQAGFADGNSISVDDGLVLPLGGVARIVTRSALTPATTANGNTSQHALSADGSVVVVQSAARDLIGSFNDVNNIASDLYLYRHAQGTVDAPFSHTLVADGAITAATLAGTLPAGLSFDATTGVISGTPTTAGSANVLATVATAAGTVTTPLAITIGKATIPVTLGDLAAMYDGQAKSVTTATTPAVAGIAVAYNIATQAPSAPGSYTVAATIDDPNYRGTTYGTLVVSQAAATVALGNLETTYTGLPQAATATTSPSGLTVSFTYDGSATPPTAAGSYAVVATVASGSYQGTASGTLVIAKAPLTVTANHDTRVYGAADPAFAAAITGFVNGETSAVVSGAPGLTTHATVLSGVGDHAITPSVGTLAAANYTFATFVPGTLAITKAPLAVSAHNQTRAYGAANPALTAKITGFVNGDTAAIAVTGAPAVVTTATASTAVGTAPITATLGSLASGNYQFTEFNAGVLTITKAPLTVAADARSKVYGADNPALTATIAGFVNGETLATSGVTGEPAVTTTATASTGAGSAPITPALGTLAAGNYAFTTFTPGTLTIAKANLSVAAHNASRAYGADNPGLKAKITGFVNGDTAFTSVTGEAALTTAATAASPANNYPIAVAPGTLSSANYAFTGFTDGTLTVTKAPLTVTADNLSRGYGGANPTLTAAIAGFVNGDTLDSATTGAPVLSTTAAITSARGEYPIAVALGTLAAANYDFSLVNGVLTVTKAVLTVTADAKSRVYGADNPALTYTITGFLDGDNAAVVNGVPALVTDATATSNAGDYDISVDTCGLLADNYIFSAVNGTLTVGKAPLIVAAHDAHKVYGAANPAFKAVFTGFVNGQTFSTSGVTGEAALATTADATSAVNTYPIAAAAGTLASANYAFTFVPGVLAVTKAPLAVTADNASRAYGAANPALSATITGFVNGDTAATAVTGTPAVSTTATATTPAGTVPIAVAVGTLASSNYDFTTFAPGTLTVSQAQLTVTAENRSRVYGVDNPKLTATITGFVNGDSAATAVSGTPALSTAATPTSAAGTYAIAASAGTLVAPNYTLAFAPGTLTVSKAVLTVTAENKARAYQAADPVFTAVITGFAAGDTADAVVTGTPAFATAATASSGVGSYAITPAQGSLAAANYSFAFAPGSLAITPATAQIALGSLNQTYNGGTHAPTAVTTPAGLTYTIGYPGGSGAPVNAGSYPVTATISDPNHTGTASGTLVIGKAAQSLSFGLSGSSLSVGASIALSATASSGLPVTFSLVSGNATLTGATLVVKDSSPVVVRATQAGDDNYLPVSAEQTLTGAAKVAQTIAFAALEDRASFDEPFTLSATASSGLPVSFAIVSGPAILDGSLVILTGATGQVIVRASQAGDAAYSPAPDVVRTFNVSEDGTHVFFGDVGNSANVKVGDVAAALPPKSKAGTLMVVAPSLGVNAVLDFQLEADGSFVSTVVVVTNDTVQAIDPATPPRAAATRTLTIRGQLAGGVISGRIDELNLNFTTTILPRTGETADMAGYYASNTLDSAAGSTASIVGTQGQMLVVASTPVMTTGGAGTVAADGSFAVAAPGATISGSVDAPSTTVSGTVAMAGQAPVSFSGLAQTTIRTDRLINLSSRVRVGPAAGRTLITGFVIGGSSAKRVLLRAVGPALVDFGVDGVLNNPRLELYNAAGERILGNDDWSGAETADAFGQVGAFALNPGTRDAALLATLAPGAYTMHVKDGGETGVALAEIYDASANPQAEYQRLVNISSRGTVESGEGVLIGGFVVTGNAPKRVLVRGVGPGLAAFGVDGPLANPRLAVYRGDSLVAQNDDWGTPTAIGATQVVATAAEIAVAAQRTGGFALVEGSRDAAVVVTLAPGTYTAQVTSADSTTGVGLVEIYEIPE